MPLLITSPEEKKAKQKQVEIKKRLAILESESSELTYKLREKIKRRKDSALFGPLRDTHLALDKAKSVKQWNTDKRVKEAARSEVDNKRRAVRDKVRPAAFEYQQLYNKQAKQHGYPERANFPRHESLIETAKPAAPAPKPPAAIKKSDSPMYANPAEFEEYLGKDLLWLQKEHKRVDDLIRPDASGVFAPKQGTPRFLTDKESMRRRGALDILMKRAYWQRSPTRVKRMFGMSIGKHKEQVEKAIEDGLVEYIPQSVLDFHQIRGAAAVAPKPPAAPKAAPPKRPKPTRSEIFAADVIPAPRPTARRLTDIQQGRKQTALAQMGGALERLERRVRKKKAQEIVSAKKKEIAAERTEIIGARRAVKETELAGARAEAKAQREAFSAEKVATRAFAGQEMRYAEQLRRKATGASIGQTLASAQFTRTLEQYSPVHQLRNSLLRSLDDYGVPYMGTSADVRALVDEMGLVLSDVEALPFGMVYGREFGESIAKAKKTFSVPAVQKALEGYAVRDQGFARFLLEFSENMRKVAIGGLLGGFGTFRYAGVNALSVPFMMAMTRGMGGAAADVAVGLSYYSRKIRSSPDDLAFTDVKGKPWTFADVEAAQGRHPLAASQTAAELDTSNLQFLLDLMKKGSYLYKFSPLSARSYVGRFADYTDRMFRQATFVNGLQRGLTEAAAAREGKDVLFDYQQARSVEANRVIGQAVYFWSFQSESLRAMFDALWRDPKQIINTYRVLRSEQQRADMVASGGNSDQARVFRKQIQGFDKQQNVVAGFPIPALESFGMAAEGVSAVLAPLLYDDVSISQSVMRQSDILLDRTSFRPIIALSLKLLKKKGLGMREGQFVPTMYVSGLPDALWPTFRQVFNVKAAEPSERKKGKATRAGAQWRFATVQDETAFLLYQQTLFAVGLQRRAEDALRSAAIQTYPTVKRVPYPYGEEHDLLETIIYEAGAQTYLGYYSPEQQLGLQQARIRSELKTQQ